MTPQGRQQLRFTICTFVAINVAAVLSASLFTWQPFYFLEHLRGALWYRPTEAQLFHPEVKLGWPSLAGGLGRSRQHSRVWLVTVLYRYVVDGRAYLSDRFAFTQAYDTETDARDALSRVRSAGPGGGSLAWYDPWAPEQSVLTFELSNSVLYLEIAWFQGMFTFLGFFVSTYIYTDKPGKRSRRRVRRRGGASSVG